MSELTPELEAELRSGTTEISEDEQQAIFAALDAARSRIADLEREVRDERWGNEEITQRFRDKCGELGSRLADAEGVVEALTRAASHSPSCTRVRMAGGSSSGRIDCICGLDAALARAAAWREGHLSQNEPNCNTSPQHVMGGDMERAVELLRRAAYVNGTSIPRFIKFDGHHWGDDARDFLASIGGEA